MISIKSKKSFTKNRSFVFPIVGEVYFNEDNSFEVENADVAKQLIAEDLGNIILEIVENSDIDEGLYKTFSQLNDKEIEELLSQMDKRKVKELKTREDKINFLKYMAKNG